ncbi:MAG: hypothetical protein KME28_17040 [Pelatocladus maniniholoensis HA4357-MV3]|jgi:hypothetical protein|uniref:Uncharacterized protein n=1 Tax=Pelatocladus maniniholoensis HA4357-MV3 TaxID=1117104 RepID=A0A9E3H9E0_9NOST|nr:hypothetical protein [Pelatocladus maniniholoensis HA4357-MV3]BAZ68622.1 hypothetical protein NIES4106_33870 [Fischerella sp. NIES-4106]
MINQRFTGVFTLALFTFLLGSCTNNLEQQSAVPENNVTTEEVADNTNQLLGKTVTIRSKPIQKLSASTFTISDKQFFGSEPILVVNATGKPFTFPADPNTLIQATGQVSKFVVADIEREYKLDLDPNLYTDYENKPAIIAQSLAQAPKPGEITTDPQQYYGKRLAVTGEVENITDANSFTLDEDKLFGGQDLLVLYQNAQPKVTENEKVAVTGVLRQFVVADLEREYKLTWNLDLKRQLEAEYSNKPVLIADEVYPSAIPQ